jgi:hypothetical protein
MMGSSVRYPWDTVPTPLAPPDSTKRAARRGRRPTAVVQAAHPSSASPDWLYHHLTISGPSIPVAAFAAAARGAGVIPWRLDVVALEDEIFVRAVSQPARARTLTIEGCRILARQFCQRVETHQAKAAAQVGRSRACPFDLHALLPVPAAVLQLGLSDPEALAWLATQWGTQRLRKVVERPKPSTGRRLPHTHGVIGYGFFTAGDTPHAAMVRLGDAWPGLQFRLVARPAR